MKVREVNFGFLKFYELFLKLSFQREKNKVTTCGGVVFNCSVLSTLVFPPSVFGNQ